jgi:hypothetical protein
MCLHGSKEGKFSTMSFIRSIRRFRHLPGEEPEGQVRGVAEGTSPRFISPETHLEGGGFWSKARN